MSWLGLHSSMLSSKKNSKCYRKKLSFLAYTKFLRTIYSKIIRQTKCSWKNPSSTQMTDSSNFMNNLSISLVHVVTMRANHQMFILPGRADFYCSTFMCTDQPIVLQIQCCLAVRSCPKKSHQLSNIIIRMITKSRLARPR
jgi:hypothetical protein